MHIHVHLYLGLNLHMYMLFVISLSSDSVARVFTTVDERTASAEVLAVSNEC